MSEPADSSPVESPLTERVLARLGGNALVWILAWGLLGAVRPWVNAAVLQLGGDPLGAQALLERNMTTQLVLSYLTILTLVATRRLVASLAATLPTIERLRPHEESGAAPRVRGIGSALWPIVLAIGITVATKLSQTGALPPASVLLDSIIVFVAVIPITTWLWTYGCTLVELDRLGRHALTLEPFPRDRGLGLRPLGSLAFTGVAVLAAAIIPDLLILARTPGDIAIGLALFSAGLALFVLSLWRLHRQMVEVKDVQTSRASALFEEAYEPLRTSYDLETLMAQAPQLSAAESLEDRAERILEWPIDERIVTRLVLIVTGVVTAVVSTFVLQQIGLR